MQPHGASETPTKASPSSDPHAPRTRGSEHELLAAFLGAWRVEGRNSPAVPGGAGSPVTGEQAYEWLPGRFFLASRWHRRFAEGLHAGTALLGFDPDAGGFFSHHYDNLGHARHYGVTVRGRVWRLAGPHERATIAFAADGASYTETWQLSEDGSTWRPRCELEATRVPAAAVPSEDVIRGYYAAFAAGDLAAVEQVLSPDLRFTSPYDDELDRVAYFDRCWPSHERVRSISIEDLAVTGNEAFVTYLLVARDGRRIRNTERLVFAGGLIASIDVYLGAVRDEHGVFRTMRPE